MSLNLALGGLALLSLALLLWQWGVARTFPLHRRVTGPVFTPPLTLLKPLKGCDEATGECLRSWLAQDYRGDLQFLFGVASADDPACALVRGLLAEFPGREARLVICGPLAGANQKVCKLAELEQLARHEFIVVSDADVRVPRDLLANLVAPLEQSAVGLVNCFYRLSGSSTPAMRWEAAAVNADFWSQVLQARCLKPLDFALGAVMAVRRACLREMGGFGVLAEVLADDYQLGHRIARAGHEIALTPVVVECVSGTMGWRAVWKHQLRWARTIRVCQPGPYFFSILSNATIWPLVWAAFVPRPGPIGFAVGAVAVRAVAAASLQRRLAAMPGAPVVEGRLAAGGYAVLKDLLQVVIWASAFLGNRVEWRGRRMRLRRDGSLAVAE